MGDKLSKISMSEESVDNANACFELFFIRRTPLFIQVTRVVIVDPLGRVAVWPWCRGAVGPVNDQYYGIVGFSCHFIIGGYWRVRSFFRGNGGGEGEMTEERGDGDGRLRWSAISAGTDKREFLIGISLQIFHAVEDLQGR